MVVEVKPELEALLGHIEEWQAGHRGDGLFLPEEYPLTVLTSLWDAGLVVPGNRTSGPGGKLGWYSVRMIEADHAEALIMDTAREVRDVAQDEVDRVQAETGIHAECGRLIADHCGYCDTCTCGCGPEDKIGTVKPVTELADGDVFTTASGERHVCALYMFGGTVAAYVSGRVGWQNARTTRVFLQESDTVTVTHTLPRGTKI